MSSCGAPDDSVPIGQLDEVDVEVLGGGNSDCKSAASTWKSASRPGRPWSWYRPRSLKLMPVA